MNDPSGRRRTPFNESTTSETRSGGSGRPMVDHYELLHPLGNGAMGIVYRALDTRSGREVALKQLSTIVKRESDKRRFAREVQILSRLSHPNIVRCYGHGFAFEQQPYFAMQLVEGENLEEVVRRGGSLSFEQTVATVEQMASALEALHAAGAIHRDVKPRNILVEHGSGTCFLADFGLAREIGDHTQVTDGFFGTRLYSSPEQLTGSKDIDRRTDVYALGCVLYFCLAGTPPISRKDEAELSAAILAGDVPPVTGARAGLPKEIDGVLRRALAVSPDDRFQDAASLARAATEALAPRRRPQAAKPSPPRSPPPAPPAPNVAPEPGWAAIRRTRWNSGRLPLILQMMLLALGLAGAAAVIALPGAWRVVGAIVAAIALTARLLLQALVHLEGAWTLSTPPDEALRLAREAVVRASGWTLVRAGPGDAEFHRERSVHPLMAIGMTLLLVLPLVGYVVHQRRWPRLRVRAAPTTAGTVLRLDAFGTEATRRAADVQRALDLMR